MSKGVSSKACPQCGGETVIEVDVDLLNRPVRERRCNELVEVDVNKPLEACMWSEEIHKNGKSKKQ